MCLFRLTYEHTDSLFHHDVLFELADGDCVYLIAPHPSNQGELDSDVKRRE